MGCIVEQRDLGKTVAQIASEIDIRRPISTVYTVLADKTKVMSEGGKAPRDWPVNGFEAPGFRKSKLGCLNGSERRDPLAKTLP